MSILVNKYFWLQVLLLSVLLSCKKKEEPVVTPVPADTTSKPLVLDSIRVNTTDFKVMIPRNISFSHTVIEAVFNEPVDTAGIAGRFLLSPGVPLSVALSDKNKKVTLTARDTLSDYEKHFFSISNLLTAANGKRQFTGFTSAFYTALDSTYKFPQLTDDELLTLIQRQTFKYFYDFAEPVSGMARERNTSGNTVTTGGSGFGVMALIVGISRGFITREEGMTRLTKMVTFLETCDRFHGAWPHWLNGATGKVVPFSPQDNGADLVETSYMIEGLITMRQYLDTLNSNEKTLRDRIQTLISGVQYTWFTRGQNVLYWHWSPDQNWVMNMPIRGYNETLITYITAAASTTYSISKQVYTQGYAQNGAIRNGNTYYGYTLPLGEAYGGPLFFTHYSFLGLDPRNLQDQYSNYWQQNVNQSLINYTYCVSNPRNYIGYNSASWGLTASDEPQGYSAHSPTNDNGVITPTAAISSIPYTPVQSLNTIRHFYYILGDRLWGPYGFYDAFDVMDGWWANSYLAIDQGPEICMIENYRSQLLWNLFMSAPDVQQGLVKLGFSFK
ncbi:MAG: glucoamylase family protein [Syntrophothermus sp.]